MTAVAHEVDRYRESFARLEAGAAAKEWAWFQPVRRDAMARFADLGFPTVRDEDWRFTNVAPIAQTAFRPAPDDGVPPARQALKRFDFPGLTGSQLVFVNGRYAPGLSSLGPLPAGVTVTSLAQAFPAHPDLLQAHLARYAEYHQDAFTALNTAFVEDGAFVS
ncbi:MAG: Fe-S cluster assembly protein SufD, partial [candidate division NC10 bacterium]|nr:Fe-S cluster assembly protein SufD [candidate division NC10 bacterium]